MDWSSIPMILWQIKQSPLHNIPNFLCHILENKREEYEAAAAIKTLPGTHLILDSLLRASRPTVTKWAMSISQDLLRQEIIQASDVESGLHFGASSARSVDLTEFDLQRITETFEITAPFTWNLVKMLLDTNSTLRYHKQKDPKMADYASPQGTGITRRNGNGEPDEGIGEGTLMRGGSEARLVEQAENDSLLCIVSDQSTEKIVTHIMY